MCFSPNSPSGRISRKAQREHVGKPALDAAEIATEGGFHQRRQINFRQLFRGADDQAADDGPRHRGKATDNQHRQGLERGEGQRELHAVARAPQHPGHQRDETGHTPDDGPDMLQGNADGQRRLMIVRHRPERPADPGILEEQGQGRHQQGRNRRRHQIELGNHHAPAIENRLDRLIDDAEIQRPRIAAEHHRRQSFNEERQANGRHEQGDGRLIDQFAQHELFSGNAEQGHDDEGQDNRQPQRRALLHATNHRQRR
jgi:hypothetical protein